MPPISFAAFLWFVAMWIITQFLARYAATKYAEKPIGKALAFVS